MRQTTTNTHATWYSKPPAIIGVTKVENERPLTSIGINDFPVITYKRLEAAHDYSRIPPRITKVRVFFL